MTAQTIHPIIHLAQTEIRVIQMDMMGTREIIQIILPHPMVVMEEMDGATVTVARVVSVPPPATVAAGATQDRPGVKAGKAGAGEMPQGIIVLVMAAKVGVALMVAAKVGVAEMQKMVGAAMAVAGEMPPEIRGVGMAVRVATRKPVRVVMEVAAEPPKEMDVVVMAQMEETGGHQVQEVSAETLLVVQVIQDTAVKGLEGKRRFYLMDFYILMEWKILHPQRQSRA